MNKNLIYREKLLYFLNRNDDFTSMLDWIAKQPDLNQIDILREFSAIFKEQYDKTAENDYLEKNIILDGLIDKFEESILDQKLQKALFIAKFENVEFDLEEVKLLFITIREGIIESILASPENNKELWKLAHNAIEAEKESGLYDTASWSAVFPL